MKTPSGVDGISYLPTLTGSGKQKQHEQLYFEFHEQGGKQAVIKDGWKLIRLQVNNPQNTRQELYNLHADPGEVANVLAQYPQKVKELESLLAKAHTKSQLWPFSFEK